MDLAARSTSTKTLQYRSYVALLVDPAVDIAIIRLPHPLINKEAKIPKVKVRYSLASVGQTTMMMMSAKLAHLFTEEFFCSIKTN